MLVAAADVRDGGREAGQHGTQHASAQARPPIMARGRLRRGGTAATHRLIPDGLRAPRPWRITCLYIYGRPLLLFLSS